MTTDEPIASEPATTQHDPASPSQPVDDDGRVDTAQLLRIGRPDGESVEAEAFQLTNSYAGIALALGIIGVIGGLFVIWMAPFAIGAAIFAEIARRQGQSGWKVRTGLITGITGIVFAGVWCIYLSAMIAA